MQGETQRLWCGWWWCSRMKASWPTHHARNYPKTVSYRRPAPRRRLCYWLPKRWGVVGWLGSERWCCRRRCRPDGSTNRLPFVSPTRCSGRVGWHVRGLGSQCLLQLSVKISASAQARFWVRHTSLAPLNADCSSDIIKGGGGGGGGRSGPRSVDVENSPRRV